MWNILAFDWKLERNKCIVKNTDELNNIECVAVKTFYKAVKHLSSWKKLNLFKNKCFFVNTRGDKLRTKHSKKI